uniref:Uncharacterized protein n=1 Tax=Arundo donax TaxID=35708 RepID=A0A0A9SXZ5_ARUDO
MLTFPNTTQLTSRASFSQRPSVSTRWFCCAANRNRH